MNSNSRWVVITLVLAQAALGQTVPSQLSFTARVANQGVPLTGTHGVVLTLFDSAIGGASLWTETTTATAQQGVLSTMMGTQTPLTPAVLDGRPLFVEVIIDGTTLTPRFPVLSVPYAVRASVAASASLLGTLAPSDVALANHTHAGKYLPLSTFLTCNGTQKMTGLTQSGDVVCGNDNDTQYVAAEGLTLNFNQFAVAFPPADAGMGVMPVAARVDHAHSGVYVPLNSAARCPGTQKAIGLNADGSPVCAPDIDTDTTYSAGAGISFSGTQINAAYAGMGGAYGSANTLARSDHGHDFVCPNGFLTHSFPSAATPPGTRVLCSKAVASTNVKWADAARACAINHSGSELCTFSQLMIARIPSTATHTQQTLNASYWLADRTADNFAVYVNGTSGDDFDGESVALTTTMSGFYCCTTGTFFR